jgi:hypothetical protein
MSSTTLHPIDGTVSSQPGISQSLAELSAATRHLLVALAATVIRRPRPASPPLNRASEAAEARALADRFLRTAPRMANEIYCAADRHETAGY